jgi:hypothetical protein
MIIRSIVEAARGLDNVVFRGRGGLSAVPLKDRVGPLSFLYGISHRLVSIKSVVEPCMQCQSDHHRTQAYASSDLISLGRQHRNE